jgi:hypothetical protein
MEPSKQPGPTSSIIGLILLIISLQLSAAMIFGRWFFGPGWFGPVKETAAFCMSALLFVSYVLWGRKSARAAFDPRTQPTLTVSPFQAMVVVILIVAFAAFSTWLFVDN